MNFDAVNCNDLLQQTRFNQFQKEKELRRPFSHNERTRIQS